MQSEGDERAAQTAARERFCAAGSYRQQAAWFVRWLDRVGVAYDTSSYWDLPDKSRYVYILDEGGDPEWALRFADHAQPPYGGYAGDMLGSRGNSDLCCDPTTGVTWRDAQAWVAARRGHATTGIVADDD